MKSLLSLLMKFLEKFYFFKVFSNLISKTNKKNRKDEQRDYFLGLKETNTVFNINEVCS